MTKVITTGNFKGGVGKTTNAVMIAYTLAKQDNQVLLVDLDPQANASDLLFTTMALVFQNIERKTRRINLDDRATTEEYWAIRGTETPIYDVTEFKAIVSNDLEKAIIKFMPNLDFIPSDEDLQGLEKYLYTNFDTDYEQDHFFNNLLEPIKSNYDYIVMDVPPQLNKFTDSALVASDYVIVVLQTQERSLSGAEKFVEHLLQIQNDYELGLDLLGILPVLFQNGADIDLDVLNDARKSFGDANMFKTEIKQMARLKRFDRTGITDNPHDIHDKRVHALYEKLCAEALNRMHLIQEVNHD